MTEKCSEFCKCDETNVCCKVDDDLDSYKKIVYCNDTDCIWNKKINFKKFIDTAVGQEHFDDDAFTGICTRAEIGIRPLELEEGDLNSKRKYRHAICCVRSDDKVKGHMDFSKFPFGGNVPDYEKPHKKYW